MIKIRSNSFFIMSAFICLVTATSCKKAIELNEIGEFTSETAVRNDADVTSVINSAFFALAHDDYYGGSFQIYNELLADHIDGTNLGGNYLGFYSRNTNIFNGDNASFYAQMSKVVYQSNLALDNLAVASAANKTKFEGQAKFLRGLANFDLVRMYAQPYTATGAATTLGIPLRLNSQRQTVTRSSVADVYQQIIKDLKDAETLLGSGTSLEATKFAAKALLAKVYFQMNDFTNAYAYANDVIENGGYVFDTDVNNRYSRAGTSETIFGLTYEASNTQGRFQRLRNNFLASGSSLPTLRITNAFYNMATSNSQDVRADWYTVMNGFPLLGKFDSAVMKMPVIHLTEMMLIEAEAAAELNQHLDNAIEDLNAIIERAYGPTSSLLLPLTANAALIKEAARRERELELVGEGNRLQELKRRAAKGETLTIRGSAYNCPGLVFPFPNNEVIYSPGMVQNPTGGCN